LKLAECGFINHKDVKNSKIVESILSVLCGLCGESGNVEWERQRTDKRG
jgi:hypothetical protein